MLHSITVIRIGYVTARRVVGTKRNLGAVIGLVYLFDSDVVTRKNGYQLRRMVDHQQQSRGCQHMHFQLSRRRGRHRLYRVIRLHHVQQG